LDSRDQARRIPHHGVILDVAGKPVANVGDVRNALKEAKTQGKHAVLMRVKMGDARSWPCRSTAREDGDRAPSLVP
jgi:hypothetical protein